ncbi:MAG: hypothetical protein ACK42K_10280, partial [Leptonema sp. (in: bacteria)]
MNQIIKFNAVNITRTPFPNSQKIYVKGSREDIKVAMREIQLSPTRTKDGKLIPNDPVIVYDTSGPYTDPNIEIDITKGLPELREKW